MTEHRQLPGKTEECVWGNHTMPGREPRVWDIGTLRVWIKSIDHDIWIARQYGLEKHTSTLGATRGGESLEWMRWAFEHPHTSLHFRALFPDRPVVVEPETTFVLSPGAKAKIYVSCPLWLRIEAIGESNHVIEELPTTTVSSTWFGSFTDGELSYWTSTRARRQVESTERNHDRAVCAIMISNTSNDELKVEKLCLRVQGFSLYRSGEQLWADDTHVTYYGKNVTSEIRSSGGPPAEAPNAEFISAARDPMSSNLTARTFAALRSLTGMGTL